MQVVRTAVFDEWIAGLRDRIARQSIARRIERLASGNPGDVKPVGRGVSEMRIDLGPGYRVYYITDGPDVIVLLAGGEKGRQAADIREALGLADRWRRSRET